MSTLPPTTSEQFYNATRLVVTPLAGYLLLDDNFGKGPKVSGGIYLPEASEEKKSLPIARILKVGPGLEAHYKPGDVVVFRKSAVWELRAGSIVYSFLKGDPAEGSVLGKVELP